MYAVSSRDVSTSRKRKCSFDDGVQDKLDDILDELEDATSTLSDVKGKLDKFFVITKHTKVPFGIKELIIANLSCKICRDTPIKPPVIFALCCKNIIGCQECVDKCYTSEDRSQLLSKPCPLCSSERGYSQTVRIHGIDELLNGFAPLFEDEDN